MDHFNTGHGHGVDAGSGIGVGSSGPKSYPELPRSSTEKDWSRLIGIGDVHAGADNTTSAQEYYERALSLICEAESSESERIPVELRIAECLRKRGRYREARELLLQSLDRCRDRCEPALRARILARLGTVETSLTDYATARLHCEEAYEILRDTDANEELGFLELTLSVIAHRLGQVAKAREQYESALFTFRRIDHSEGIARTLNNLGVLLKNGPRWAEAKEYFTRALAVSEEAGNFARIASHCLNLGILYYKTGEWKLASSHLTRALLIFKETGSTSAEIKAHLALGNLKLRRLQYAVAENHYQQSLDIARQHGYRREEALALEFLGEGSLRRGDLEAAEGFLRSALDIAVSFAPEGDVIGEIKSRQAQVWLRRGRQDRAIQLATEALVVSERIDDAIETGACLWILGTAVAETGRMELAADYLAKSIATLSATPDVLELARARLAQARVLGLRGQTESDPAAAKRFRKEAAARFEEIASSFVELDLPEVAVTTLIELAETHASFHELDEALSAVGRGFELVEKHAVPHVRQQLEALRTDLEERCAEATLTRSAEFQLLQEVAGTSPRDPGGSIEAYLRLACERSRSDRALLALEEGRHRPRIECRVGFDGREADRTLPMLAAIFQDFRAGRKIYVVNDPGLDARYQRFPDLAGSIGAAVAIPISPATGKSGLLYLDRNPANLAGAYRNPDLRLLSFFSGIVSVFVSAREGVRRLRSASEPGQPEDAYSSFITCNTEMRQAISLLRKLDASGDGVLVTGETGTGKGLLARLIHQASNRSSGAFVPINCAALPEALLESELFGHEQGAFTGAVRKKRGLFEEAEAGTLFLDEVDKAPLGVQGKLLHVLDKHEIRPVGSTRWSRVDVRVICATNVELRQAIEEGRFLEDLYYRLNDFQVHIPPLRERREDIPLLVRHFYEQFCRDLGRSPLGFSREAMQVLTENDWRGNVRELEKVIKRVLVLADNGETIGPNFLPREVVRSQIRDGAAGSGGTLRGEIQKLEARMIEDALQAAGGNKSEVARRLRISYPSLLTKIKQYGLETARSKRRS
jgi:DNA-binding NtrC family response regulator/tetratricopeptide (TPR) repeat protein